MTAYLAAAPLVHALWVYVRRFGAFVFFPLGLLDMSFLAPGSFDALLIVLTAARAELWWYYALMATGGSVFGTLLNFQIGLRGGAEVIEKRLGPRRSRIIFSAFERWGFWSLFVAAIAPPPMPASAMVLAAGALRYPLPNFLLAWTTGRLLRFGLIGWVTARYGSQIFQWLRISFRGYYKPALWTILGVAVLACAAAFMFYIRERRRHCSAVNSDAAKQTEHHAA
jgi:membrane protein YqaA with SNARE-associated domain